MVRTIIGHLPAFVKFDGCTFQLILTVEEGEQITLAYIVTDVPKGSDHEHVFKDRNKWLNRVDGNIPTKHLIKETGIRTDMQLRLAVHNFTIFIKKYTLS